MGTAFTQQGQYKRDVFVQLHYLNDENMVKIGCTWPGKQSKLTCSSRGFISNYTKKVPAKLQGDWQRSSCSSSVCLPLVYVRYAFISVIQRRRCKAKWCWGGHLCHTYFTWKARGMLSTMASLSITQAAFPPWELHWFVVREVCHTTNYYWYWEW